MWKMILDVFDYMASGYIEITKDEKYIVKKNAPKEVIKELKETDDIYFNSYGEHIFIFENSKTTNDSIFGKIKNMFK